ncbi:hypothetical protein FQZ97_878260 [compost metagenome]
MRLVQLRLQGDGVHEDVAANALAEHLLDLAQVGGGGGAVTPAAGVHHVEHHHLAADQVVHEADLAALVGDEGRVGEPGVVLAGVHLALGGNAEPAERGQAEQAHTEAANEVSSSVHGKSSRRLYSMSKRSIIAWSSWIRLWQCITYLPT